METAPETSSAPHGNGKAPAQARICGYILRHWETPLDKPSAGAKKFRTVKECARSTAKKANDVPYKTPRASNRNKVQSTPNAARPNKRQRRVQDVETALHPTYMAKECEESAERKDRTY